MYNKLHYFMQYMLKVNRLTLKCIFMQHNFILYDLFSENFLDIHSFILFKILVKYSQLKLTKKNSKVLLNEFI